MTKYPNPLASIREDTRTRSAKIWNTRTRSKPENSKKGLPEPARYPENPYPTHHYSQHIHNFKQHRYLWANLGYKVAKNGKTFNISETYISI